MLPTVRSSSGALAFLLGLAVVAPAAAHGDDHAGRSAKPSHQAAEQYVFGLAGDPAKVSRTITVEMSDAMRFSPSLVQVERGETVRFVLKNSGRMHHEMVIGTQASLEEHARQMKKSRAWSTTSRMRSAWRRALPARSSGDSTAPASSGSAASWRDTWRPGWPAA